MEFASKGVAGAGLGLGIAGTALGVLSGILASVPLIRLGANMQDEAAEIAYRAMSEQYEKNN